MPNYLERVVAAGARTAALARPPVAAPLRLPVFGQLWSLASEAVEFAAQLSVPSGASEEPPSPEASVPGTPVPLPVFQEEARATPRGVGQPAPTLSATPALRMERATPAPGALEVNTVIQAPPSLRPALPPAAALAVPPPPATVSAPLSPSREASAAPRLSQVQGRGKVDRQRVAPGHAVGPAQSSVPSGAGEEPPSPEASVPGAPVPLPVFQEEARATPRGVGQPAPTLSATPALRVERATPAPGALEVNTVIQAPPSLRPALPPATAPAVPLPPDTVSVPLSPSREASAAPRLSQVQGRGEVDRQRVAPGYTVADAVQMPRIGESVPSAADIARPRQTATTAGASATVEVDYSLRSDAQRLPGQVTPPLDVGQ